jgi:hypothetical protein
MATDDGAHGLTPDDVERVSTDLRAAARLVHRLPDDAPDKDALQRRLAAVTAAAKHDLGRAHERLGRLLEDLRARG